MNTLTDHSMASARILDELSQTGVELLLREPFYAHLFSSISKEVVGPGHPVDTLAVGLGRNTFTLYVNRQFWDEVLTEPKHRLGVVKHEMIHLVFRHLLVEDTRLDSLLMNIAFDLVVNQYIPRSFLPEESVFLESFPDLQLRKGQTWLYYYKQLEELRKDAGGEFAGTPSKESLQQIQSDSHGMERHQPWREIRSKSDLEKSVVDTQLESLLRTAHQRTSAAAWGNMPGDVRELLGQGLVPPAPSVNWRILLRLFAEGSARTQLQNTRRRPSRRIASRISGMPS